MGYASVGRLASMLLLGMCLSGQAQANTTTHHTSHKPSHTPTAAPTHTSKPHVRPAPPAPPQDLWQQLARDFKLDHETYRPEVQAQINWFVSHPKYLARVAGHAYYYMYYIHQEVVRRHLPGEFVLLPMIESAYDPYAYSWVGAAGIWQMMPQTGMGFGLTQDWWYDARKSIVPSTKAALGYLYYLHSFFNGDWLLATAAYNYGEGNVQASINRNASVGKNTDFWSLTLPLETESYVPRLLALSAIVANPGKYGVHLPYIANQPYFGIVELNQQLDLSKIADMANISTTELYELNPGFTRFATEPNTRYQLLLPVSRIALFESNLAVNQAGSINYRHPSQRMLAANTITPITDKTPIYTQNMRNLSDTSVQRQRSSSRQPNPPSLPPSFHASPDVTLPTPPPPTAMAHTNRGGTQMYIVKPHETLYSIAKKHGLTVTQLETMNNLSNPTLKPGDVLVVG